MSTNPRTPEFYPFMKVRGTRRRQLAPFQGLKGSFRRFSESAGNASRSFVALTTSLTGRAADD